MVVGIGGGEKQKKLDAEAVEITKATRKEMIGGFSGLERLTQETLALAPNQL